MTLKYERTKKCQLSSMMTETMPESPSEILEVLKAVAVCVQEDVKRNSGFSILGELKWSNRKTISEYIQNRTIKFTQ